MNMISLLVLAGIAVFLILRLRSVLGTREGFEAPKQDAPVQSKTRPEFEVIEGGPDLDISDHVTENSADAHALAEMKRIEPSFAVGDFVQGSRAAYEMIVMGFERGDLDELQPLLAEDVFETFVEVVSAREDEGIRIDAEFVGVREVSVQSVEFDETSKLAEITMRFVGELTSVVHNSAGDVIEGSPTEVKRQKDSWTFAREMGSSDPNWRLVATDA